MGEGHLNGSEILFVKNSASTGFASRIHVSHNTQCENDGNALSRLFDKNFAKSTFINERPDLTKYFSLRVNFTFFHTVLQHQQLEFYVLCSFHECDCRLQILWYVTSKSSKWRENWLVVFPENCLC